MGPTASDEFGHDQARLHGFAKTHAIRQEQSGAAHADRPHHGNELVGGDVEAAGLHRQEGGWAKSLVQEESLVIEPPLPQKTRPTWIQFRDHRGDRFEGMEEVDLNPSQIPVYASEAVSMLAPGRLGVHHFPGQPTSLNLGPRQNRAEHVALPPGQPQPTEVKDTCKGDHGPMCWDIVSLSPEHQGICPSAALANSRQVWSYGEIQSALGTLPTNTL